MGYNPPMLEEPIQEPLIDPERVHAIISDCLWKDDEEFVEAADHETTVEGITQTFSFNPERLESHREEIEGMLKSLPSEFDKDNGGGWSFLNACMDRNGFQWTGLHMRMDELFVLGTALGRVESLLPRDMWSALPGGMPYYAITFAE